MGAMPWFTQESLEGFVGPAWPAARTFALVLALSASSATGCGRRGSSGEARASGRRLTLRVPAALRIARGIDTLSVGVDPASCADTSVAVDPARTLGVESTTRLFVKGATHALSVRHAVTPGSDLTAIGATWTTRQDGIPEPDKSYVVEVRFALFETDARPASHWNPHAGRFKALLTRTIRQAEE
jgi:hypothetical protein